VTSTLSESGLPSNLPMSGKLDDPIVDPTNAKYNSRLSCDSQPVTSCVHGRIIPACVCVSIVSLGVDDADLDSGIDTHAAPPGDFSGCHP
jgi:hypothetical protein